MSDGPVERPSTGGAERRGSVGRYVQKLRAAMKRRSSSSKDVAQRSQGAEQMVVVGSQSEKPVAQSAEKAVPLPTETKDIQTETTETSQPDVPLTTRRNGSMAEKARLLYQKYGEDPEVDCWTLPEPPAKVRRVEKPISIRIHRTCHECGAKFAKTKLCVACGHRKCDECPRLPAKRVREMVETAKEKASTDALQDTEKSGNLPTDFSGTALQANGQDTVEPSPDALPTTTDDGMGQSPRNLIASESGEEDLPIADETLPDQPLAINLPNSILAIRMRGNNGVALTHEQALQRSRLREFGPPQSVPDGPVGGAVLDQDMVPTVQRVYRKPRQRIRWTCDQCQVVFTERDTCRNCGHQKCVDCIRNPPKRARPAPDPLLLQAVEDRIAAYRLMQQPVEVAAPAG